MKVDTGEEYFSKLDEQQKFISLQWKVIILLSVIIAFLSVSFLTLRKTVIARVELPAKILEKGIAVVGINHANTTFYKLWGKYLNEETSNFTPDNINEKVDQVYKMMKPTDAVKNAILLDKYKKSIIDNKIFQDFTPTKTTISTDKTFSKAVVTTFGIAKQKIGSKQISPKECRYQTSLSLEEGVLYVTNYGSDCL